MWLKIVCSFVCTRSVCISSKEIHKRYPGNALDLFKTSIKIIIIIIIIK